MASIRNLVPMENLGLTCLYGLLVTPICLSTSCHLKVLLWWFMQTKTDLQICIQKDTVIAQPSHCLNAYGSKAYMQASSYQQRIFRNGWNQLIGWMYLTGVCWTQQTTKLKNCHSLEFSEVVFLPSLRGIFQGAFLTRVPLGKTKFMPNAYCVELILVAGQLKQTEDTKVSVNHPKAISIHSRGDTSPSGSVRLHHS